MLPIVVVYLIHFVVSCIEYFDKFLQWLNVKICFVTMDKVMRGLNKEEKEMATKSPIAPRLEALIEGFEKDEQMDLIGRYIQVQELQDTVKQRTFVHRYLIEHPEVYKVQVKKPVFVVGLPRSGTTLLQRMFALDTQFKVPTLWDTLYPLPETDWQRFKTNILYDIYTDFYHILVASNVKVAHHVGLTLPEECYYYLKRDLFWYQPFLNLKSMKKHEDWFYNMDVTDQREIYDFYKKQLQLVVTTRNIGDRTMLLKAHLHLMYLEILMETFPDAKFVFSYRKLTEILPSYCSFLQKQQDRVKLDDEFGQRVVRLMSELANRAAKVMQKCEKNSPFHILNYESLMTDPIAAFKDIYKHIERKYTPETEDAMRKYLVENPQHKHGKHVYSMEQYGITKEHINKSFQPYLQYFAQYSNDLI